MIYRAIKDTFQLFKFKNTYENMFEFNYYIDENDYIDKKEYY